MSFVVGSVVRRDGECRVVVTLRLRTTQGSALCGFPWGGAALRGSALDDSVPDDSAVSGFAEGFCTHERRRADTSRCPPFGVFTGRSR
ncbi:hypothetical protein C5C36_13265 [Rathayibacter sp. AY1G1]|nr:hypothetical protein C5C54_04345 [Rathayibacter sp. AY1F2]PPH10920.1 hypothetical protein C5C36_13265 [Rathayibacter sp. AY1G1]PPH47507.1 hypothetical protein C5C42_03810 [Rathayibacter sp. AY1F7]PPI01443.1 hypothetical protein C5C56_04285 [Rathayibacter sp. AY1D1]